MSNRQEIIDKLKCSECGMNYQCRMDCSSANTFKALKTIMYHLPYLSDEQLATLSFECWHIAYNRSGEQVESEMKSLVDEALKRR